MNLTRKPTIKRCHKAIVSYCEDPERPECGCTVEYTYSNDKGENVGFISVFYGERTGVINNLKVPEGFRRQGLATKMVTDLVEEMKGKDHPSIKRLVAAPNLDSQPILDRLGFKPTCRNEWTLKV